MTASPTTIWLVDDDRSVLTALSRLLESAGHRVEACASAEEFLQRHDAEIPGCVVVDLQLPGMDGFGLQDSLAAGTTDRPVVFLTGHGDIPASVRAMKAGAVDFLTKPIESSVLLTAVAAALDRDLRARQTTGEQQAVALGIARLTPREREVLTHVVAGRLNKQIAADLGIAEKTVKVHRGRMMEKMGVRTVADLVRLVTLYEN